MRLLPLGLIAFAVALAVVGRPALADGKRVALVIGVGAYQAAPKLINPARDATAVAAALRRLGFDTSLVLDPDRTTLEAEIRDLGDRAQDADAVMVFYAGHAVEANGRNALVPVSAKIASARDMPFETVDIDRILDQVDGRAHTILIFLDACRDNPFQHSLAGEGRGLAQARGLAAPADDVSGTLIAFATAPGHTAADGTGPDSPFTTALLAHIETPGLEVHQLLALVRRDVRLATNGEQIPWDSSALEGDFYFRPGGAAKPAPATPSAAPGEAARRHCHVPHLTGRLREGAGAIGTMTVSSDGRGCSFSVWRRIATHDPYDALDVSQPPAHGTVHIEARHRIVYVPQKGFSGKDAFGVASTPKGVVAMQVLVVPP
jgi:hypothetical protein